MFTIDQLTPRQVLVLHIGVQEPPLNVAILARIRLLMRRLRIIVPRAPRGVLPTNNHILRIRYEIILRLGAVTGLPRLVILLSRALGLARP